MVSSMNTVENRPRTMFVQRLMFGSSTSDKNTMTLGIAIDTANASSMPWVTGPPRQTVPAMITAVQSAASFSLTGTLKSSSDARGVAGVLMMDCDGSYG